MIIYFESPETPTKQVISALHIMFPQLNISYRYQDIRWLVQVDTDKTQEQCEYELKVFNFKKVLAFK